MISDQRLFAELAGAVATSGPGTGAGGGAAGLYERHASEIVSRDGDDPAVIDELQSPEDYERLRRAINRDLYRAPASGRVRPRSSSLLPHAVTHCAGGDFEFVPSCLRLVDNPEYGP